MVQFPKMNIKENHLTRTSCWSGPDASKGARWLSYPWSCQRQSPLVVHTPAPVVLPCPLLQPHRTFLYSPSRIHHTSCHLPLCPQGPVSWKSSSSSPTAAHSSPSRPLGVWLSFPSSSKPLLGLRGPLSIAPSSLPSWYLSRVCPPTERGYQLTVMKALLVTSTRKKNSQQIKKKRRGRYQRFRGVS